VEKDELSVVPSEARSYQGTPAGVATRFAASGIDGLAVVVSLLAAYGGYLVVRLVISPRSFEVPDPTLFLVGNAFFAGLVVYLTFAWWIAGRTVGNHVMGLQVVSTRGGRLGFLRSLARAVLCAAFPIGLLWCALDPARRSLQDLALRTTVVYNWLPSTTGT
jgi:uncharacterized RDD family membrane protein YckC